MALHESDACIADTKTVENTVEARELTRIIQDFLSLENCIIFLRCYWFADSYREIVETSACLRKTFRFD